MWLFDYQLCDCMITNFVVAWLPALWFHDCKLCGCVIASSVLAWWQALRLYEGSSVIACSVITHSAMSISYCLPFFCNSMFSSFVTVLWPLHCKLYGVILKAQRSQALWLGWFQPWCDYIDATFYIASFTISCIYSLWLRSWFLALLLHDGKHYKVLIAS